MLNLLKSTPKKSIEKAIVAYKDENSEAGWKALIPLLESQKNDIRTAKHLVKMVGNEYLPIDHGLDVLSQVFDAHKQQVKLVSQIGSALEAVRDIDELNLAAPEHPLFQDVVDTLLQEQGNQNRVC